MLIIQYFLIVIFTRELRWWPNNLSPCNIYVSVIIRIKIKEIKDPTMNITIANKRYEYNVMYILDLLACVNTPNSQIQLELLFIHHQFTFQYIIFWRAVIRYHYKKDYNNFEIRETTHYSIIIEIISF